MKEYVRFSKNKTVHNIIAYILDMLDLTFVVLFVFLLFFSFTMSFASVQGSSMFPILNDGDHLLVWRVGKHFDCGDIIIANIHQANLLDENGHPYSAEGLETVIVKRVIAVGGQTVEIDFDEGAVYLDGQLLSEEYARGLTTSPTEDGAFDYPIVIPEGYLFVMGDNRKISKDSRYPDIGLVHVSDVVGKVLMRVHPLDEVGLV